MAAQPNVPMLRSVVRKLGLNMPAWQSHYADNKTIEEVNIDKIDYVDVVLTRAQKVHKHIAGIRGARRRNVDPELQAEVDETPELHEEYLGTLPEYDSQRAPSERSQEFLLRSRYPPLDESDQSPPKDYVKMAAPIPSYDQGHEQHQGFGSLGRNHIFWSQRLHEPGEKLKPGDWANEPCDSSPVELAQRYIASYNRAAEHRATRDRLRSDSRNAARSSIRPTRQKRRYKGSNSDTRPNKRSRTRKGRSDDDVDDDGGDNDGGDNGDEASAPPELSRRQLRKLQREEEQQARRRAHNKNNRVKNQVRRMSRAPQQVFYAKHIVAPGPTIPESSSPPSSPTFSPRLREFSPVNTELDQASERESEFEGQWDDGLEFNQATSSHRSSNPPSSPAPSSAPASEWGDLPSENQEEEEEGRVEQELSEEKEDEWDLAEQAAQEAAEKEEPIDWEAINSMGLDANSIYGAGMPNSESLPTPGTASYSPCEEFRLRTTSTGWTGGRAASFEVVALLWAWMHWELGPILRLFTRVPFSDGNCTVWTIVKDR